MHKLYCDYCSKLKDDYNKNIEICGNCREVNKYDLVLLLKGQLNIYLSSLNRNNKGRKSKITADTKHNVRMRYKELKSMNKVAKEFNLSKTKIFDILHEYDW